MDPFNGSETSNLRKSQRRPCQRESHPHDIDTSILEHLHTLVVIQAGID